MMQLGIDRTPKGQPKAKWWGLMPVVGVVTVLACLILLAMVMMSPSDSSQGAHLEGASAMRGGGSPGGPCICSREYMPVCAGDPPKTMSNKCEAACQGAEIHHQGACEDEVQTLSPECMACTDEYVPVCGTDKLTYLNPCVIECSNVEILRKGICSSTMVVRPRLQTTTT
ncbi:hypothetical protein FOA52_010536 [Chlamydomonas sp. UWO 241]|nr:hypothetical protein FOA52_010536 [Chlamydomonas sp. UWO 241]